MKKTIFTLTLLTISIALAACGATATIEPVAITEPTQTVEEPVVIIDTVELTGITWEWVKFTDPTQQFEVSDSENYTVEFQLDGTLNVKADCNNALGSYIVDGSSLNIEIGPMTRVMCGPESRSDEFVQNLGFASIYFFEDGKLYIDLMADGGTFEFDPTTDTAEGAIDGALPADLVAQLDAFLQSQIYQEGSDPELSAPGIVLLVDTPDGRYLSAAGVSNIRLEIGSNSKSFTVVLLMQLVEEGKLYLDDPLSKWLPDQAASIPNGDQMTLRQLAQHTTGVWGYGDAIIGAGTTDPVKLIKAYTPEELVQYVIDNGTPDFAPGEEGQWKYSNTGYILLGMVIEAASGEKLGDLYQAHIFDPLELESAIFIEGVPETGTITNGYWWTEDGERHDTTNWNVSQGWAAGGNAMTAEDLLTYAKALSTGELFQNPDSLDQMLTFDPNGADGMLPYGLGLTDYSLLAPGYWGHSGQTAGFDSLWYTNPETGITVIGLTNSAAYSAFSFLSLFPIISGDGTDTPEPIETVSIDTLTGETWEWVKFTNPIQQFEVSDSENYTVEFQLDGALSVKADCNNAFGSYTVDGSSLTIEMGPMTLVACPPESRGDDFAKYLGFTAHYFFEDGNLYLDLMADGGTMVLAPADNTQ